LRSEAYKSVGVRAVIGVLRFLGECSYFLCRFTKKDIRKAVDIKVIDRFSLTIIHIRL
jgi:hypothetical protein